MVEVPPPAEGDVVVDPGDALEAVLQALLSNDNAIRQQAERELKKLGRQPEACLKLLEAAGSSSSIQVGHHQPLGAFQCESAARNSSFQFSRHHLQFIAMIIATNGR